MTKREADELTLIEDNITVDEKSKTVWCQYPLIKDPAYSAIIGLRPS